MSNYDYLASLNGHHVCRKKKAAEQIIITNYSLLITN